MNFRFRTNSVFSIAEIIINGVSLFLLYKIILSHLGVAELGLWSLVLSTTSLARLGDLGAAAGLSRFVASAIGVGDVERAKAYFDTAFIVNLVLYGGIALAAYFPLDALMAVIVPHADVGNARVLLPYAIASFLCLNLAGVSTSGLIGLQKSYLKSIVSIASVFIQVGLAFLLTPKIGLLGVAVGQIVQYIFTLLIGYALFSYQLRLGVVGFFPLCFRKALLKEMLGFGVKLQAANIINFLFEPLTKFAFSRICGLESLGYFEMAYKYVMTTRNIIGAPLQSLLPAFAHMGVHSEKSAISLLYDKSMTVAAVFGFLALGGAILLSVPVSIFWLGKIEFRFALYVAILSCGLFLNLLSSPAYYVALSKGHVSHNLVGHLITCLGSPLLGAVLALAGAGSVGFIAGTACAMGLGSIYLMFRNCRDENLIAFPTLSQGRTHLWSAAKPLLSLMPKIGFPK